MSKSVVRGLCAIAFAVSMPFSAQAEGHGPLFGLATPTLARGQWSSDTTATRLETERESMDVFREMLGYGLTEDLQASLTFPLAQRNENMMSSRTRTGSMMGAASDVEASLLWRFHRTAPDVGMRRESTLFLAVSEPGDGERRGVNVGNGINLAAVTGFASRVTYWWLGAGVQHYLENGNEQLGDVYYASAVFGWRPPLFRQDYPKPDWRVFIEGLAEHTERDRVGGRPVSASGGQTVLVGPSVLGLYGRWGIEAGALWPISQSLNGNHPEERYRAKLVFTYWF